MFLDPHSTDASAAGASNEPFLEGARPVLRRIGHLCYNGAMSVLDKPVAQRDEPRAAPAGFARRMALAGIALGAAPWLLLVPLGVYQMDFMLWTWIWPAWLGLGGSAAGLLAWRLADPRARSLARVAIILGLVTFGAALTGFLLMLAAMYRSMPGMTM